MDEGVVAIIASAVVIGLPVLALSARIALRPVVESIARLKEAFADDRAQDLRVARMEEELERLADEVRELRDAEAFHRRLEAPPRADRG